MTWKGIRKEKSRQSTSNVHRKNWLLGMPTGKRNNGQRPSVPDLPLHAREETRATHKTSLQEPISTWFWLIERIAAHETARYGKLELGSRHAERELVPFWMRGAPTPQT